MNTKKDPSTAAHLKTTSVGRELLLTALPITPAAMTAFGKVALVVLGLFLLTTPAQSIVDEANSGSDGISRWTLPTDKAPDQNVPGFLYNLGPTGARGILKKRSFVVKYIFSGSPAYGKLRINDEIIGAGDKLFSRDHIFGKDYGQASTAGLEGPIMEFANAIEASEGGDGNLVVNLLRGGARTRVILTLEKIGRFSSTFPLNCPKSKLLAERATNYVVQHPELYERAQSHTKSTAGLALVAAGKLTEARDLAYAWNTVPGETAWVWPVAYQCMFLSEYFLQTGDERVEGTIGQLARLLYKGQVINPEDYYGRIHNGYNTDDLYKKGGFGHEIQISGYAVMNITTLLPLLAWELAEECGIPVEPFNKNLAYECVRTGTADSGYIGYHAEWGGYSPSGRQGLAIMVHRLANDSSQESYISRVTSGLATSKNRTNDGHASASISLFWSLLGIQTCGDTNAIRQVMDYNKAYINMARMYDGSFVAQPGRNHSEFLYYRSPRMNPTASMAVILGTANSRLRMLGKSESNNPPNITRVAWANPSTIELGSSTTVGVGASDPDGDPLTYAWSKVSGPGSVSFGNYRASQTSASFSLAGTYRLRVTVSDGKDSITSEVSVNVTSGTTASVSSFTLMNSANNNASLGTINDGATINLSQTGKALNIRAEVSGTPGQVNFTLSGAMNHTKTEQVVPYCLFGDVYSWNPPLGNYTLTANCDGSGSKTVRFSVISGVTTLPTVTISASDASASESGPNTGTFRITRSGSTANSMTVYYAISGTATRGSDYNSIGTSTTLTAGSASGTIAITPIDDSIVEGNETVILRISSNSAYSVGSPSSATVNIADNDSTTTTRVTGFTLVNAGTNRDISALNNGATVNLGQTGKSLNIRANTVGTPGKVHFTLTGAMSHTQTESYAPYALFGDSGGDYISWTPRVGSYTLTANCDGSGALTIRFSVTDETTPPPPPTTKLAINCGGPAFYAADGTYYQSDRYYTGSYTYQTGDAIASTGDDTLYRSERYGKTFGYNIPLADGTYTVTLKMAEIYWYSSGRRIFTVRAEGVTLLSNFDIHATAGHDNAHDRSFTVRVTGGNLDLDFSTAVNNAKISAILIRSQ